MRWTPRRARLAILLIPAVVFAIKFRYVGSGDTVPAELLPVQILTRRTLTFPAREAPLPYWLHATPRGVVSNYPILPGIVNVPVFAAARLLRVDLEANVQFLSHVTAALCALASIWFVYLILERLLGSPARAFGFALIYAFGTDVWSMASRGLFQHGPALMFLSAGLYALLRRTSKADVAAGVLLCLAVLTRPTTVVLVLPLVAWAALPAWRRTLAIAAGAAPPALLHAAYGWYYWGSPFSLAQPVGPEGFHGDPLQGLAGLLVSPSRGLFVFTPVFLFAIPAAVRAFRRAGDARAPLMRALAIGTVLTIAVYSPWHSWWGGHSFGYRLLAELALPLVLLTAWDWDRIRRSGPARVLFAAAVLASLVIHGLGSAEYPSRFNENVDFEPQRLWDVADSELGMIGRKVLHWRTRTAFDALAPALRPADPPRPFWRTVSNEASNMDAALDRPTAGVVRGPLVVLGWAKPAADDFGEVLVTMSPGDRRLVPQRFPRPDLTAAIPRIADASSAGFGLRIRPPRHLEAHAVLVEVRDRRGEVRRFGPVDLLWGPDRRLHHDAPPENRGAAVPGHESDDQRVGSGR